MKRLTWYTWGGMAVLILGSVLASCVEAQCGPGGCPTCPSPSQGWQAVQPAQPITQRPLPAVCRVVVQRGRDRVIGSGVLIWKGPRRAVVLTAQHLFRVDCGHRTMCRKPGCNHRVDCRRPECKRRIRWERIQCEFPNGAKLQGERVETNADTDLGAVVIPAPEGIEPLPIHLNNPKPGEQITLYGFGQTGQFRGLAGIAKGYSRQADGQPAWDLIVSGAARGGDSGGPMLNASGEIVGIIWGTDGETTRGAFCGAVCQFLSDDKYKLPWFDDTDRFAPWNAKTEQAKIKAAADLARPQAPPLVAVTRPGEVVDATARRMAQDALDRTSGLQQRLADSHNTAVAAVSTADSSYARSKALEEGIGARILSALKTYAMGYFKQWGLPGVFLGGVLIWAGRRWVVMRIAQAIDLITDKIPGTWDDKLIDAAAYKAASIISGQPIPEHAMTPGVGPWGKPIPGYQPPVAPQPTAPPVQPAPSRADLAERLAALEERQPKG